MFLSSGEELGTQFALIETAKAYAPRADWQQLRLICNSVNDYFEVRIEYDFLSPLNQVVINVDKLPLATAHQIRIGFQALRHRMHQADPSAGCWYVATIGAAANGSCGMSFDLDSQPTFEGHVTEDEFVKDFNQWRIDAKQTPKWLAAILDRHGRTYQLAQ
jgi:hypothetical protein